MRARLMFWDVHRHVIPRRYLEEVRRGRFGDEVESVQQDGVETLLSRAASGPSVLARVKPEFTNLELHLQDMARLGFDAALLSAPPFTFQSPCPPEGEVVRARVTNEGLYELCEADSTRFRPLAVLPMRSVEAACQVLEECVGKHGFAGAEIGTHVDGVSLAEPRFSELFEVANRLRALLLIHPGVFGMAGRERLQRFGLDNYIGLAADTAVAAIELALSGALGRWPHIRFVLSHGGGVLPYLAPRVEHGYARHTPLDGQTQLGISLRQCWSYFWYDSVVHSEERMRYLYDWVGPERIVLGTDHPFEMADEKGPSWAMSREWLSDEEIATIASARTLWKAGNA